MDYFKKTGTNSWSCSDAMTFYRTMTESKQVSENSKTSLGHILDKIKDDLSFLLNENALDPTCTERQMAY